VFSVLSEDMDGTNVTLKWVVHEEWRKRFILCYNNNIHCTLVIYNGQSAKDGTTRWDTSAPCIALPEEGRCWTADKWVSHSTIKSHIDE
jgi:hypothetical protein